MMQSSIYESSMDPKDGRRPSNKRHYKARFVKESFAENYTVETGKKFEKVWTFRNDGPEAWPADTKFMFTNGEQFGQIEKRLEEEVGPQKYVDVSIEFVAPEKVGKYCAFYRFAHGKNERFGQKVWCDIMVIESENEIAKLQREMGFMSSHPMNGNAPK
jgi:Ig-like domain from next to BRCA1 gene